MAWNYKGMCPNCGKDLETNGSTTRHVETEEFRCPPR